MYYYISSDYLTHLKQVTKNKRENAYFSVDSPLFQLKELSCLYK